MDEFISLFGNITIATIVQWAVALGFLVMVFKKFKEYLDKKLKEEAETKQHMENILRATERLPQIEEKITNLEEQQAESMRRLDKIESDAKRRERNTLRDRLLQSYRYYTSTDHNPLGEWTKMESEAFEELYRDYVDAGGNGYIHSEVKPAMDRLIVIDMADQDGITTLMQSRK